MPPRKAATGNTGSTLISGSTLVALGLSWLVLMAWQPYQLAYLDVHGVIASSYDYYPNIGKPPVTVYTVRESDGTTVQRYDLGPFDTKFAVGTDIEKSRWSLTYSVDGRSVARTVFDPFGLLLCAAVVIAGLVIGVRLRLSGPR